jgi:phosphoglycerol transferase MdoB-like AlkP superfamily enzyme
MLAARGYTTIATVGHAGDYWNLRSMMPALGFATSYFEDSYQVHERFGLGMSDGSFLPQVAGRLQAERPPFLAMVLTVSSHFPYGLPPHHQKLALGRLQDTMVGKYLQAMHYLDGSFGEFIDRLREARLLDSSVVVVFGDHHGWLGEAPELRGLLDIAADDPLTVRLIRKRVPLMIRLPGGAYAGDQPTPGGHLDIAPTLLALLGIAPRGRFMLGRDLNSDERPIVVLRDGSFIDDRFVFLDGPRPECYATIPVKSVDCRGLADRHREAVERLTISDLILRGDLIPQLSDPVSTRQRH